MRFGEVTFSLWAQYGGRSFSGGLHGACTVDILSFKRSGLRSGPVVLLEHAVPFVKRTAGKFRQIKPVTELKMGLGTICFQGKEQMCLETKLQTKDMCRVQ